MYAQRCRRLMWSFVNSQENQVYIWLAIDRQTRKILGVHFGDRSRKGTVVLSEAQ